MKRETFWEVSWYAEPPLDEFGNSDWDRVEDFCKNFTTKTAAIRYAEKLAPKTYTGEVSIQEWWKKPCRYELRGWEQEYIGESEFVQAYKIGAA